MVDLERFKAEQADLAGRRLERPLDPLPRYVAGADCAFVGGVPGRRFIATARRILAAAVVWDRQSGQIVDRAVVIQTVQMPYVPGYLGFREGPAILEAVSRLAHGYGAILFDGQGLAHPRRCGVAVQLGVTLDVPSVGVAKSRLVGEYDSLSEVADATSPLTHRGEIVGTVWRSRAYGRPLFVSVGHQVDLASAMTLVRACRTRYRLPEPTRLADRVVADVKRAGGQVE